MEELKQRIQGEGIHVGGGIVKVDGFINHQVDAGLIGKTGQTFAARFAHTAPTKVLTAEVSGITPAFATAQALGAPMIYARKRRSAAMTDDYFSAAALSRTRNDRVELLVSKRYLQAVDRVLLIDDFLATGSTLEALVKIVAQAQAALCGMGCLIEKPAEGGRKHFEELGCRS